MQKQREDIVVFDANDKILGRLASTAAKSLLNGKNVAVINAENAVISGNKATIAARYRVRLNLQEKANPEHSPYWSRRSDLLVKRIIRGMLPYNKPRGKSAYRRLRVYIGVPDDLRSVKPIEIKTKEPKKLYVGHVKVGDLSTLLGYYRK
ncbi:MAG: 50S ribosomal protein L13 [Candidatus Micrarchaeaceae archaeon]